MQVGSDGPQMDWHLLERGAGAPPGNLRIAEAVPSPPPDHFKLGFARKDIIEQRESFLDYARKVAAISPRILSEFENGSGNPTLATLEKIASPFGLKVTFLPPESWRIRAEKEASADA
jgi:hypothetical protein